MSHNLYVNRPRNWVIFVDFVFLNVIYFACMKGEFLQIPLLGNERPTSSLLVVNLAFVVAQYFYSNIVHRRQATFDRVLRQVTMLVLVFMMSMMVLMLFMDHYGYNENSVIVDFSLQFTLILYITLIVLRYAEMWLLKSYRTMGRNTRHVVFVGSDPAMVPIYEYFVSDPSLGYQVTGYYSDTPIAECPEGFKRKGTIADLQKVMADPTKKNAVDEVFCSLPVEQKEIMHSLMRQCIDNVVHFFYVPTFAGVFGRSFSVMRVGGMTVLTRYNEPLINPVNKAVKRLFDIAFSGAVLLMLLPFIPFIALIIKIQSPGPVFFKQERTGLDGRNFMCYKFRSMHVNKDADRMQATEHDPRKFAFGNFMRKANIDELPQFWNVFIGNMSIVGPRPHMLHHTEVYRELIGKYMVRHLVKPGITGWAQVTGFRGETKELWQMEGRVRRDIWYIENWSIWLDLRIIVKTFVSIFVHDKNAY